MKIDVDDVTRPEVLALLEEHLGDMRSITPPEHVFAFDASKLRATDVTFWTAWDDDTLVGCAALKELSATQGEVKSMRTPAKLRRTGAGRALLNHIIGVARARGYRQLFLETGKQPAFAPAHSLYRSAGFRDCGPFGPYTDNGNSVFMSMRIDTNVVIRPGLPADAHALAELAARTFRETFAADNSAQDIALHEAEAYGPLQQGAEIVDPNITTRLGEVDGRLVAFAQLRRGPAPACVGGDALIELWRFYVARDWHGSGIAQRLMADVHTHAIGLGARTLWLGVWERNERAKAFYRKCGFVDVGSHVYVVGTDAQTDRVMARALADAAAGG